MPRSRVADGRAELLAGVRVLGRHLHAARRSAVGIGSEQDQASVSNAACGLLSVGQQVEGSPLEAQPVEASGAVCPVDPLRLDPGAALDQYESTVCCADDDQLREGSVRDVLLDTAERSVRAQRLVVGLPAARFRERHRADRLAQR